MLQFNFRGLLIEVEQDSVAKLSVDSGFAKHIQYKYGKTLNNLTAEVGDEKAESLIYLNRNGFLFYSLLDYFESGKLHFPHDICSGVILDELEFWGIDPMKLSLCCLNRVLKEEEEMDLMQSLDKKWKKLTKINEVVHPGGQGVLSKGTYGKCQQSHVLGNGGSNQVADEVVSVTNATAVKQRSKMCDVVLNPTSCIFAKLYCCVVLISIILSVLVLLLETVPSLRGSIPNTDTPPENGTHTTPEKPADGETLTLLLHTVPARWLTILDVLTTTFLTFDFLARLWATTEKRKFLCRLLTIVDIVSIVPVWLGLIVMFSLERTGNITKVAHLFRYMALLRALRIFRFCHIALHNKQLRIISLGISSSLKELLILVGIVSMYSCLFGILVFYLEAISGKDTFRTGFDGVYWAVITMTTVGYGDLYPVTEVGRIFAVACCMVGIVVIAMATTILVNTFFTVYQSIEKIDRLSEIRCEKFTNRKKQTA